MKNINNKKREMTPDNYIKKRSRVLGLIFIGIIMVWLCRIAYIQVIKGEEYRERTNMQLVKKNNKTLQAIRGSMTDRNGYELVFSKRVFNMIFDPSNMQDLKEEKKAKLKEILSKDLKIEPSKIDEALAKSNKKYVVVKKGIDKEVKESVDKKLSDAKIPGISYEEDFTRKYLGKNFACHLIGFATNGTGRWGLEYQYDKYLKGVAGREFITFNDEIPTTQTEEAQDGASLVLTIDKNIQLYIEDALKGIGEKYNPLKASIIVMNPSTGEILGMANYPSFDLNNPNDIDNGYYRKIFEKYQTTYQIQNSYNALTKTYDTSLLLSDSDKLSLLHRNIAVSDTYEPGSTFKPLLVAAAFEEGVISENTTFNCDGGLQIADKYIRCMGHHGLINARQVLENSCNVGVMEIAKKLKRNKFYAYQKAFGIGEKTGIDLPGEADGAKLMYQVNQLNDTELATSSFGQSFQLTSLQMLTSFCASINGGKLMRPYVVSEVVDSSGAALYQNSPLEIRRVISTDISNRMKNYLKSCVDDGLAKGVKIDGYAIGGKTGTSEKIPRELEKVVTSFCTFAPVNNPKIAMIVTVDDPEGGKLFGSTVAGPASKEILEKILQYMGVPKSNFKYDASSVTSSVNVGTYTAMSVVDAINSITSNKLSYKINGEGTTVTSQIPAPGTKLSYNGVVTLNVSSTTGNLKTMPNVVGMTYEDAYRTITDQGLKVAYDAAQKAKIVESQVPLQGVKLDPGTLVAVSVK